MKEPEQECVIPLLVFQFFFFHSLEGIPVRLWFYGTQVGINHSGGEELWFLFSGELDTLEWNLSVVDFFYMDVNHMVYHHQLRGSFNGKMDLLSCCNVLLIISCVCMHVGCYC